MAEHLGSSNVGDWHAEVTPYKPRGGGEPKGWEQWYGIIGNPGDQNKERRRLPRAGSGTARNKEPVRDGDKKVALGVGGCRRRPLPPV